MPPAKKPKEIDFSEIDLPGEVASEAKKGKKKPPPRPITKTALRKMFETLNGAFALAGHLDMMLQDVELDTLAEAWHDVIAQYPQIGSILTQGNRFTVWGNALFVTFVILERRRALFAQAPPGPARDDLRNDGQRQNDPRAPTPFEPPLRASSGYQA